MNSQDERALVILSGGMDSTTLAYLMRSEGYSFDLLSIDYGQRHAIELEYAEATAKRLAIRWDLIDLSSVGKLLEGSSLTDDVEVPDGHYAAETMRATVVPNRNAIMLSVAFAVAVAREIPVVGYAAHAGDHPIYPDCRPEFAAAFDNMERIATEGYGHPNLRLHTPFMRWTKAEIAKLGIGLGLDYALTWSCYKGDLTHCGECGTCYERREAFELIGHSDPTVYKTAWSEVRVPNQ